MRNLLSPRRAAALALCSLVVVAACGDDDPVDPTPPNPPTNLQVAGVTSTSARVNFNVVSGASGYIIERAPGAAGGTFVVLDTVTAPPFDDTGLTPQATYRYRVAAISGSLKGAYTSEVAVTLGATPVFTLAGNITANKTLDRDTVWKLAGFVKVTSGATLTIESGTKIVGDQTKAGSALFILRGARIEANGTAAAPIVLTSEKAAGQRARGDWGGLIIVGNGLINRTGTVILEGSNANVDNGGNPGIDYGGGSAAGDAESSGTVRYTRVEFAGYAVATNQELNSFTFAAVGSGTTLENLQSVMGLDDSFEWFGGAVNGRYLVSYESGDDHFDAAEGYRGKNQFLIAFQSTRGDPAGTDPQGFEVDGCAGGGCTAPAGGSAESSQPYNMPVFANFTVVGNGDLPNTGTGGGVGMVLRRGTGGTYINGVVARWPRRGISVRDSTTFNREAVDSLIVSNVLLAENVGGNFDSAAVKTLLGATGLEESAATTASLFLTFPTTIDANTTGASFDWTPATGSAIATGGMNAFAGLIAARNTGNFITPTAYRGAAAPAGPKWWQGWTAYYRN